MIAILLLFCVAVLLYYLAIKPYTFWSKRNVKTGTVIPVFGDNFYMVLGRESFLEFVLRVYNKLTDVRFVGLYQFQEPVLLVKSPEIIKQICVKDFDHFLNHSNIFPEDTDELWSKNLFTLKGKSWKNMRSTLSPSFTSSRMRAMFVLICQNADSFVDYYMEKEDKLIEVEMKDAFGRFTIDVIANIAYGIKSDSLKERDNEFFTMGKEASTFGTRKKLTFFMYQLSPAIATFFRMSVFGNKVKTFFSNLVRETMIMREEKNIERPDILGRLIKAKNGRHKEAGSNEIKENSFAVVEEHLQTEDVTQCLTDSDVISNCFMFFIAGFDGTSTVMSFMAHELAINQDVQQKLIEEIDRNKPLDGPPSYETIVNMEYLDMVVSETLRKWPGGVLGDRVTNKPYIIQSIDPEETPVHLAVKTKVMIPIYAIHHDPKYYENPERFDPERFSPENRKKIDPYTYLPFGVGPRNCIASRFALLEIKAVYFYLLSKFEIVPVEKTQIPLKISRSSLNLAPENGFQLGLKRRP